MKRNTTKPAIEVKVVRLAHANGLDLPAYQTSGSAGMDLIAAVPARKPLQLAPGARVLVPTGLILELPKGTEAQVRPRSGLALRHGITVLNSPGTIDSDYRGEVMVLLANLGTDAFDIRRGERIAQLVIQRVEQAVLVEVDQAAATAAVPAALARQGARPGAHYKIEISKLSVSAAITPRRRRASAAAPTKPGRKPPVRNSPLFSRIFDTKGKGYAHLDLCTAARSHRRSPRLQHTARRCRSGHADFRTARPREPRDLFGARRECRRGDPAHAAGGARQGQRASY
jgi:dUTP pyrophosphatase